MCCGRASIATLEDTKQISQEKNPNSKRQSTEPLGNCQMHSRKLQLVLARSTVYRFSLEAAATLRENWLGATGTPVREPILWLRQVHLHIGRELAESALPILLCPPTQHKHLHTYDIR
jgi:hypothetical protein